MSATRIFRNLLASPRSRATQTKKRASRTLRCESLETREVPAYVSGGTLYIDGTPNNDVVTVEYKITGANKFTYGTPKYVVTQNNVIQQFSPFLITTGEVRFNGSWGEDKFINEKSGLRAIVDGGPGNDTLTGGWANDELRGNVGNDSIMGGDGADDLYGNEGNDQLIGAYSTNGVEGGDSTNDTLAGGDGKDSLWGGYGDDLLIGGNDNDWLDGQWGHDMVVGSNWDYVNSLPNEGETTTMLGTTVNDILFGSNGNDTIQGGYGNDTMSGGWDSDLMYGSIGNDRMWGAFSNSPLERLGAPNDDTLEGGHGDDQLYGGEGNDILAGNQGQDFLYGGTGSDSLWGAGRMNVYSYPDAGNYLFGEADDDSLYGGDGYDWMDGGFGDDGLFGGAGYNLLYGGADDDRFLIAMPGESPQDADDRDAVLSFASGDKLWTDTEVAQVDIGLNWLHHATRNTSLLKLSDGSSLTFSRVASLGSPTTLADNDSAGTIQVADAAFTSATPVDQSTIHEIGHNWDNENEKWTEFQALSGWGDWDLATPIPDGYSRAMNLSSTPQPWAYRSDAEFSRLDGYGRTNPREDFATCLETYYTGQNPSENWQSKWDFINNFLISMSD